MKENMEFLIPNELKEINQSNHIPNPPTPEGFWKDKGRDYPFFQKNVPLSSTLGGVSSSAGCLTEAAEAARQEAECRYYCSQEEKFEQILKKNKGWGFGK